MEIIPSDIYAFGKRPMLDAMRYAHVSACYNGPGDSVGLARPIVLSKGGYSAETDMLNSRGIIECFINGRIRMDCEVT